MSRYDQLVNGDKVWDRYGLSESEWAGLTIDQRLAHYHRQDVCEHAYAYAGIETDKGVFDLSDKRLEEQYSFDPYSHTRHGLPHMPEGFFDGSCECQGCVNDIGISRDSPYTYKRRKKLSPGGGGDA